jgi:hypothetical protein
MGLNLKLFIITRRGMVNLGNMKWKKRRMNKHTRKRKQKTP